MLWTSVLGKEGFENSADCKLIVLWHDKISEIKICYNRSHKITKWTFAACWFEKRTWSNIHLWWTNAMITEIIWMLISYHPFILRKYIDGKVNKCTTCVHRLHYLHQCCKCLQYLMLVEMGYSLFEEGCRTI